MSLTQLLLQITVILVAARACGLVLRAFGQPMVIGEMAAGLLLGPAVLGALLPQWHAQLFPATSLPALNSLATLGVVLFMFIVGAELRAPSGLGAQLRSAAWVGLSSMALPMALGVLIAPLLHPLATTGIVLIFVVFILLRVTPTYSDGDFFVQAQAEIVANKDQSQTQPQPGIVDADDAWVRVGEWRRWDLMLGRFEAFEIYNRGMALDVNTQERLGAFDANSSPPDIYGATYLFDRPGRAGNVALHLYPERYLRFELLAQYGGLGQYNELGGRPAAIFDIGWLKLKAAFEYQWLTAKPDRDQGEQRNWGFAGSAQFVFVPYIEGGINYGFADNQFFDQNGNRDSS